MFAPTDKTDPSVRCQFETPKRKTDRDLQNLTNDDTCALPYDPVGRMFHARVRIND